MKYRIVKYENGGYVAQFGRTNKRGKFEWSNLHPNHLYSIENAMGMVHQHKARLLPHVVVWEDGE